MTKNSSEGHKCEAAENVRPETVKVQIIPLGSCYGAVGECRDGRIAVCGQEANGMIGFIDRRGELKIPFVRVYAEADETLRRLVYHNHFMSGLFPIIGENGKYGYIDTDGRLELPCVYDFASLFGLDGCTRAIVGISGESFIVDRNGNLEKSELESEPEGPVNVGCGVFRAEHGGKIGFVNGEGEHLTDFVYDDEGYISYFSSEGLCAVRRDGKLGFIDVLGREVIPPGLPYDYTEGFVNGNGTAVVFLRSGDESLAGLIDKTGREIVPPKYSSLFFCGGGILASTSTPASSVLLDMAGELVAGPWEFSADHEFGADSMAVRQRDGRRGVVRIADGKYTEVVPFEYDDIIERITCGTAIAKKVGKFGLLDGEGNTVVPFEYDHIGMNSEGIRSVQKGDEWFLLCDPVGEGYAEHDAIG